MVETEKEESFLGANPQWFPNTHGNLQLEATNITFFIDQCNAGTDPKKQLVDDARIKHATCRSEQQAVMGSNVTQNCTDEKKAACDMMQSLFEESYCNYADGKENYCTEFEACHAAAESAYDSTKQGLEQQEQDLHEMFTQHTRLECKISAWPLTTSSKNACDSMTVDTSHLSVTYPAKPVPLTCTHPVVPVPGDSDWVAAEYSSKSWAALVEPVTPCTTTTTTTTQGWQATYKELSGSCIHGHNLPRHHATVQECADLCDQDPQCQSFEYDDGHYQDAHNKCRPQSAAAWDGCGDPHLSLYIKK